MIKKKVVIIYDEQIYIECKARDNLSATDISSFVFNSKF